MYLVVAWMLASFLYLLVSLIRRIRGNNRFDRSMHGELMHAVSMATYQVRLSQSMRWNILPIGGLLLLSAWEGGKLFGVFIIEGIAFALAYYAGRWEHGIYKARNANWRHCKKNWKQNTEYGFYSWRMDILKTIYHLYSNRIVHG